MQAEQTKNFEKSGNHNTDWDGLFWLASACLGLTRLVFVGARRHNASWIVTVYSTHANKLYTAIQFLTALFAILQYFCNSALRD